MTPIASKELSSQIDAHVGSRVRMRRKSLGLTQTDVAEAVGLTFQQVQKYERGTNRISASKLYETAQALKAPVAYFFEGYDDQTRTSELSKSERNVNSFLATSEGIEIAEAFPRIKRARYRRKVAELVVALADDE